MGVGERERGGERERERERERELESDLVSPEDCSIPSNADMVGEVQREIFSQVKEVFNTTVVDIHKRTLYIVIKFK